MNEENRPLYQQIHDQISRDILSGRYAAGDRIPSEKELSEEFKVSRITSKKALDMLSDTGLIRRMPGKGSFVTLESERVGIAPEPRVVREKGPLLLGFIISDFDETYGTFLLAGIEQAATEYGCFIITKRSRGNQDQEERAIDDLLELGVDGLLIMPVHGENYNPKILRLVLDGFPLVFVDRYLKGLGAPFVVTDNISAAKKATDYLLDLGHRNISFLSLPYENTSVLEDRVEGFVKSHAEHVIATNRSIWLTDIYSTMPGKNTREYIDRDIELIRNLLQTHPEITCLFAAEHNIALLAMKAIRSLKLRVPQDICVVCFDGPRNFMEEYAFTHIRQREEEMGEVSVRILMQQIRDKTRTTEKIFLDSDLIVGYSTTPVKG